MLDDIRSKLNFDYRGRNTFNNDIKYNPNLYRPYNTDINCNYNDINNMKYRSRNILGETIIQNKEKEYYTFDNRCNPASMNCINNTHYSEKVEETPLIYSKPYNPDEYEENQFKEFLKDLMLAEGDLEKTKIQLSQCQDFNIEDCFCIFEHNQNSNNELYPEDIKLGLQSIGVFISDFELKLFFNRYDLRQKGFLNFSDFFDIFIPFSEKYRSMSEKKTPNPCANCGCPQNFSNKTLSIMKNLLDAIIRYENKFNFMRRGFTTLNLKLKKLFGKIDTGKTGAFSNDDLVVYMKKNRIFTDNKELDLLFIRLDKNRNGKIDFKEIYDETHPVYF